MGGAKIAIRSSFTRSVTQLFCSFQVTFKVVYGRTVLVIGKVFTRGANLSLWVSCLRVK